ncbi:CaiB/BaiF CoA transferase family protein [Fodinicola acaciae]|uniref:CaiB/BaiF CoA transferase family protein n=1 Tax=Fodinicola acaciae TaxID=2681555 RepID=UPI0013D61D06|nr:CaiB/BaiF CoA-transferase family protein [Fodinicola acaciae]
MSGPLQGLTVIELAGLAPAPFAATVLADLGADVIRVERTSAAGSPGTPLERSRRSITLDTKQPDGVEILLKLVERSDVLIEGFRPGVTERAGYGPAQCLARNPRLIYGRMTGWGQEGPLAPTAGHDIDYIAIAGALDPIGRAGQSPVPPLNLVGDFGGGGLLLATGVLAALYERERSGKGQVVDAAMVDGAALLTTFLHGMRAVGMWNGPRGTNLLDGGAPFYDTYETADGKHVAIGALEPKFYDELRDILGFADVANRMDPSQWPELRERIAAAVRAKTRDEWAELAKASDACLSPVLTPAEAPSHPHNAERGTFVEVNGVTQPAPAPRFDRTPAGTPQAPPRAGQDTDAVLTELGFGDRLEALRQAGTVA